MVRGHFKGLDRFVRICNTIAEDGETAMVEVSVGDRKGRVVFVDGELYHARLGHREGVPALAEILQSRDMDFWVRDVPHPLPRKNVFVSLSTVFDNMKVGEMPPSPPPVSPDGGPEVEEEVRIAESAEAVMEDPRLARAYRVYQNVAGVEGVIYAQKGRVVGVRGFGERDLQKEKMSPEEMREIRQKAQRWVDRMVLLMNAASGIYRQRTVPQKILLNFPDRSRWIWAWSVGEDLYVVFLNPTRLAFMETRVFEAIERELQEVF